MMTSSSRLHHLDMLRGLAALLVLAGHLRAYAFQSFGELAQTGLATEAFYFATGLGHQAVMIFFALSGFLVGGKALDDILKHRFDWARYMLRRLSRLWIVIVPAMALTLFCDSIGLWLTGGVGYDGRYFALYATGPGDPVLPRLSATTLLGNLAFLQTIHAPIFGSNGPMWSLANEFWYYVVFPLALWLALARLSQRAFATGLAILLALAVALPWWLLEGGAIWVAGAAASWCARRPELRDIFENNVARVVGLAIFGLAIVFSKTPYMTRSDLALGLATALVLPVLANLPAPSGIYAALGRALSEISYTLYLTHFPFLTLLILGGLAPARFAPGLPGAGVYVGLMSAALLLAAFFWWCFERNTDRVYSLLAARIPGSLAIRGEAKQ